jgi:hypothetical protein
LKNRAWALDCAQLMGTKIERPAPCGQDPGRSPPTTSKLLSTKRRFRVGGHIAWRTKGRSSRACRSARRTPRWMLGPTILGFPSRTCRVRRRPCGPLLIPRESAAATRRQDAGINAPGAAHRPRRHSCRPASREA